MAFRLPLANQAEGQYYHGAINPSHFDHCADNCNEVKIKNIVASIENLRAKSDELDRDWKPKGAGSTDYKKWKIVSPLLKKLDELIGNFNRVDPLRDMNDELNALLALTKDLIRAVNATLDDPAKKKVLQKRRNEKKNMAKKGTEGGLIGGAAVRSILYHTFFYGSLLCVAAAGASIGIQRYTGMDNPETTSYLILQELKKQLAEVEMNLNSRIVMPSNPAPRR